MKTKLSVVVLLVLAHYTGAVMGVVQDPCNIELISQIGGIVQAVALQGNLAYIGLGPHLVILDVSDPVSPNVVGQTGVLPGVVNGVAVAGPYAYVADGPSGFLILRFLTSPIITSFNTT